MASRFGWRRRKTSKEPILFHKGALREDSTGKSTTIGSAIEGEDKVVSVVINAVDDLLTKGDQIKPDWSLNLVPDLEDVVTRAEAVGRAIVLTADHGHVVDLNLSGKEPTDEQGKSERWRAASKPAGEGEVEVRGNRVVLPEIGGPVILPWSETVRYRGRRSGYHGGISPQEVVVPLGVFVPTGQSEQSLGNEWGPEAVAEPSWWSAEVDPGHTRDVVQVETLQPKKQVKSKAPKHPLFDDPEAVAVDSTYPLWISDLFASEVYAAQRAMVGRQAPQETEIESVLTALLNAKGTATFDLLRSRTKMIERRLRLFLIPLARLLNVDGIQVLAVDNTSRTVTLNQKLLAVQFDIKSQ